MYKNIQQGPKKRSNGGRRRRFNAQINLPSQAPSSQALATPIRQPNLFPSICVTRMVDGPFNIANDGINPSLAAINFSLSDVPGYGEFTAMWSTYCIEQVEIWFRPEYTVLSDASALSNSVNVEFYSAIDLVDGGAPTAVTQVQEYQSCAHTSIVTTHYRKIRPSYMLDAVAPSCARVSTASPSLNWFGLKIAVPPCGIAMTFRAVAKYKIVLTSLK